MLYSHIPMQWNIQGLTEHFWHTTLVILRGLSFSVFPVQPVDGHTVWKWLKLIVFTWIVFPFIAVMFIALWHRRLAYSHRVASMLQKTGAIT